MTPSQAPLTIVEVTLTAPQQAGQFSVTIRLKPDNQIVSGGQSKPLGECTLAELAAWATDLEQQWATLVQGDAPADVTLAELVERELVQLESPVEGWQQAIVVLGGETGSGEPAGAQHPGRDSRHNVASRPDAAHWTIQETEVEESAETDPPTPAIHVAVPQPVHPERDAPPPAVEEPPATPDQKVRVAGRLQPPGSHNNLVDILLNDRPMHLMQGHALGSPRREVAGFMLGPLPEKQPDGRYIVHVTDTIIAQYTKMSGASVTYTPESWRYAQDVLADRYPDGNIVMVGWYHTHPGFGIFLSNMDLFIHTNFFTQKWHIAYVLDPVSRRSGFFSWDRPQRQVIPYDFLWPDWAAGSW